MYISRVSLLLYNVKVFLLFFNCDKFEIVVSDYDFFSLYYVVFNRYIKNKSNKRELFWLIYFKFWLREFKLDEIDDVKW